MYQITASRTFQSLPAEIKVLISTFVHPHKLHTLRRLSRHPELYCYVQQPSFAFTLANIQRTVTFTSKTISTTETTTSTLDDIYSHANLTNIAWSRLGVSYMAALLAILGGGVSVQALTILGIEYTDASTIDPDSSLAAALLPDALSLLIRNASSCKSFIPQDCWSRCDSLAVQITAISGWTHVFADFVDHVPNFLQNYGNFALDFAAANNCTHLVDAILKYHRLDSCAVDLGRDDSFAFRMACLYGHVDVVRAILDASAFWRRRWQHQQQHLLQPCNGNQSNFSKESVLKVTACDNYALIRACQNGHTEVVRLLLSECRELNPMDFNARALIIAIENRQVDVVALLLKDERVDWTILPQDYQCVLIPFIQYLGLNNMNNCPKNQVQNHLLVA
ncbi:hypothetical protein HK100_003767 [Physocladia obscura]|uniref:Ankyrin n=1 Tax=Physocladia obscura TaxID=109957 RepID=A0AAD5STZ4_9FUNG|nr:hypothetical protein HK100_003767 [Physocladia obscura]